MRYQPAERLFDLLLEIEAARHGLSIDDITQRFRCGRRTAERLLAAARRFLPQLEPVGEPGRVKRWRLAGMRQVSLLHAMDNVGTDEFACLDLAAKALERDRLGQQAELLRRLSARLKAGLNDAAARRTAPDLEAMVEAEGLVFRPGPQTRTDPEILARLRYATIATRKLRIRYRYRLSGKSNCDTVHPLGFLYGARAYLIAYSENARARDVRYFVIENIESAELLETPFHRPRHFNLERYARQSFGVFQEEPVTVVWRFHPPAADEARSYLFHPSQEIVARRDGSIDVRFRAGGIQEMAWYLARWGDSVTIIKPARLRRALAEMGAGLAAHHGAPRSKRMARDPAKVSNVRF